MPTAPPSRCLTPRCRNWAVRRGLCADHRPKGWTKPSPRNRLLDRTKWSRVRAKQLRDHPNCAHCGKPATIADHIIPVGDGGALYAPTNIQSLCPPCDTRKTRAENRQRVINARSNAPG